MQKIALILTFALAFASVKCEDIPEEDGVLVLTEDNFDSAIKDNQYILVEFYAPWCGHCKKLAPEYAKAAQQLKEDGSNIKLAKVDATEEKELGNKFGVRGFPTIKFFKSGSPMDYAGPRDAEGIVQWLLKKTGPPAIEVNDVKTFNELKENNKVIIIGCFKDKESKLAKEFISAADQMEEHKILITSNEEVMKAADAKDATIALLKSFDDPKSFYLGEEKAKDIVDWMKATAAPLVWEFTPQSAQKIFQQSAKVHFLYFINGDNVEEQIQPLKMAAKKFKGKVVMVYLRADVDADKKAQVMQFFGITDDQLPMYALFEVEDQGKYLSKAKTKADEIEVVNFLKKYFNKELEKTLKSEDVPEDWDKEPVKVLVGKNFEQVALDKSKDVFVEFYAPWCGHCKALAPVWEKLGEEFAKDDSVVIAKMDATANEVGGVQIKGFPTLKLWKKGSNEVVDFNGARDFETLVHFVKTGEMKLPEKPKEEAEEEASGDAKKDEL